MKKKDLQSLRDKKIGELYKIVQETKMEIVRLKLDKAMGRLKNVHLVRVKKRDLAQALTLIKEKLGDKNTAQ